MSNNNKTYKQKLSEAGLRVGKAIGWAVGVVVFTVVFFVCKVGKKSFEYLEEKAQQGQAYTAGKVGENLSQAGSDVKEAYHLRSEAQKAEEAAKIDEGFAEGEVNLEPLAV